jgi:hypothetical protein
MSARAAATIVTGMTTSDWLLDIALLLVVFRQVREARIGARFVLLPLAIVAWAAHTYLHGVPTAGHDPTLVGLGIAAGCALGVAGGLATRVRFDGSRMLARAGAVAVILWILGMGARMAFALYSEHGGAPSIARFSRAHDITTEQAWVTALVLMAFTEVAARILTIVVRGLAARRVANSASGRPAYPVIVGR